MRTILSALALFGLWLLMSGVYKTLIIGLGAASAIFAVYMVRRMDRVDQDHLKVPLKPFRFITYAVWLVWEVVKSNVTLTKLILAPDLNLRQHIFRVPNTQKSELAEVIFANSITLTPGTITVETEGDAFWVHAVSFDESDHEALADMDRRVTSFETGAA
ncbi:Na+/H+ antiporter subunit E [Neptunicoccus cionae]|uniref:Sodium:proton antiporter n=1 Tax=Neptunicoccus cionae TaxID=2035344 RepID=A0A916QZE8_9RHOB|nr:Na+/H+ antiporter subunit E [Amylibacter cionae]GGA22583.1 sodium:proton antiporter [Amylibacter cionae]